MAVRILNIILIVGLVLAAGYVYRIKFDAVAQAERVAKLRAEIRRERDTIAALRAQWAQLDSPDRVEKLTSRHLPLKPEDATQFDDFEHLPERPPSQAAPESGDAIGAMIENLDDADTLTGTISMPPGADTPENGRTPETGATQDHR